MLEEQTDRPLYITDASIVRGPNKSRSDVIVYGSELTRASVLQRSFFRGTELLEFPIYYLTNSAACCPGYNHDDSCSMQVFE